MTLALRKCSSTGNPLVIALPPWICAALLDLDSHPGGVPLCHRGLSVAANAKPKKLRPALAEKPGRIELGSHVSQVRTSVSVRSKHQFGSASIQVSKTCR